MTFLPSRISTTHFVPPLPSVASTTGYFDLIFSTVSTSGAAFGVSPLATFSAISSAFCLATVSTASSAFCLATFSATSSAFIATASAASSAFLTSGFALPLTVSLPRRSRLAAASSVMPSSCASLATSSLAALLVIPLKATGSIDTPPLIPALIAAYLPKSFHHSLVPNSFSLDAIVAFITLPAEASIRALVVRPFTTPSAFRLATALMRSSVSSTPAFFAALPAARFAVSLVSPLVASFPTAFSPSSLPTILAAGASTALPTPPNERAEPTSSPASSAPRLLFS